jgi:hypothetical protein
MSAQENNSPTNTSPKEDLQICGEGVREVGIRDAERPGQKRESMRAMSTERSKTP